MKIKWLDGPATEGWRIATQTDAYDLTSGVVAAHLLQVVRRVSDGRLWFRTSNLP